MCFKKWKNTRPSTSKMIKVKGGRGGTVDPSTIDPNAILNDENFDDFVQEILDTHNKHRKLHGVQPLELKDEISTYSQNWADSMAKKKEMKHSSQKDRPNYGENLYYSSANYVPGSMVVNSWYSEAEQDNYQYGKEPKDLRSGHFTQVVWKQSQYLGIGATVWEKGLFVVCNYEPQGNITGRFSENVPPPIEK